VGVRKRVDVAEALGRLGLDFSHEGPLQDVGATLRAFFHDRGNHVGVIGTVTDGVNTDELPAEYPECLPKILEDYDVVRVPVETGHQCSENDGSTTALLRRFLCYDEHGVIAVVTDPLHPRPLVGTDLVVLYNSERRTESLENRLPGGKE
jgi:hypothetical protein